jgi:hypothetical protein
MLTYKKQKNKKLLTSKKQRVYDLFAHNKRNARKEGKLDNRKYNIKAVAAICNTTITELAEKAEIKPQRLYDVSTGRRRLTGAELAKLEKVTGISADQIDA